MGRIFSLTPAIIKIGKDAFDDLLDEFGEACKLIFPPKWVDCEFCSADPIGNKPSNRYLDGGPIPFPDGTLCTVCGGSGKKAVSQTRTIRMIIDWEPAEFKNLNLGSVRTPGGIITTKCAIRFFEEIKMAIQMIAHIEIEARNIYKYKLQGEPVDIHKIIKGEYVKAIWQRI